MQNLPFVLTDLWDTAVRYPWTILSLALFVFTLNWLANCFRCYGLPKNLLFGAANGALAFALFQLYGFLGRNYGLHSLIFAEFIAGYETAAIGTVLWRFVFAQRPPQLSLSAEEYSA